MTNAEMRRAILLIAGTVIAWVAWLIYLRNRPAGAYRREEEEDEA